MVERKVDVVVIGAGPAGLAAAIETRKQGIESVLVLERDDSLGGILQQCIHDGFGIHRFKKRLSGGEYAQNFIDELKELNIEFKLGTMVLEINENKEIYACNEKEGILHIQAKAIILAMGCRERTASQVRILGYRPAGVYTAGAVQRYINMEGYIPGKKAVILGSGDIGLIMARRMQLEGIEVKGVYEVMPNPGGLSRNIEQCLNDYGIPLHLATTVAKIDGKKRIKGITVVKVDDHMKPIEGTEEYIECDMLVLAVGLIPENELSTKAGINIDPKTKGPILDENLMTSIPGIFAAGNVAVVFDLVDYVSISGEIAARGAVKYLKGEIDLNKEPVRVQTEGVVNFAVPQVIRDGNEKTMFFMRVKAPSPKVKIKSLSNDEQVAEKNFMFVAPAEMVVWETDTTKNNMKISMEAIQ